MTVRFTPYVKTSVNISKCVKIQQMSINLVSGVY